MLKVNGSVVKNPQFVKTIVQARIPIRRTIYVTSLYILLTHVMLLKLHYNSLQHSNSHKTMNRIKIFYG